MEQLKTMEEFDNSKTKDTVFLFTADWCSDCRYLKPFLPEIETLFPEYTFMEIDRDQFIGLCQENGIMGIPSFIVYKNGKKVGTFISKARKTKAEIESFLKSL